MASLTPLSKGLIALAVVGAMTSAVWHLLLKDRLSGGPALASPASGSVAVTGAAVPTPAAPKPAPIAVQTPAPNTAMSAAENFEAGRKLLASGDMAPARSHLEAAVKAEHGAAACLLGEMTLKGQGGLAANQEAASRLFQLAQSRGSICFAPAQ